MTLLSVLDRELDAEFDLACFRHVPRWDPERELVDIRLRSLKARRVRIGALGLEVDFAEGEELHTETSGKFRRAGVERELREAGLHVRERWTAEAGDLPLSLSEAV